MVEQSIALAIMLCVVTGCCPDPEHDPVADAGAGATTPDAEINCAPVRWMFGDGRYCDECTCPGMSCAVKPLGAQTEQVGECGADLQCSLKCTDPLWLETHGD